MKKSNWTMAAALAAALSCAPPAASITVIDPTNLAQNILQATRALEQIHNQIQQIEQQAQMLARNPLQLSPELSQSINQARQLFSSAQGLAFDVDRLSDQMNDALSRHVARISTSVKSAPAAINGWRKIATLWSARCGRRRKPLKPWAPHKDASIGRCNHRAMRRDKPARCRPPIKSWASRPQSSRKSKRCSPRKAGP